MFSMLLAILPTVLFWNFAAAQSPSLSVVCVAGQCVQGLSNTTLGATLSAANAPTSLHLLPGTYSSTTNPQLLHQLLISSGASLSPFPGFENVSQAFTSSSSLPLDLAMSPGLTTYASVRYSGQASYTGFQEPSSSSDISQGEASSSSSPTQMTASSLTLSDDVYMIVGGSSNASDRVVLWDSVPDVTQLPLKSSLVSSSSGSVINLNSISLYSTTCNPTCSSNGVCSPLNNTCLCAPGFTGSSCESCAPGFFGPTCQACPGGCDQCDEDIQGTGRCLKKTIVGKPEDCGCVNGQCGNNGQCVCNAGWQDAPAGEKCAKCQDGFFLTSTGDCQVCQAGCSQCADTTGTCIQCKQGFSLNSADNTKCDFIQKPTSTGQTCPSQSFSDGDHCSVCSSACRTCNGPTSNDCVLCASGRYLFNGNCVGTNGDGVCEGTTSMMGNNLKGECDACPSKCTSCKIPGFSVASTIDQIQCTGCLPGFVLSQGKCVESCPSGTFLSPQDNLSCIACDSSCSTCADSADFCLTCNSPGQLAFNGKCISACPSNTFTSNSTSCTTCHGDCASCSGAQFNQCTSCTPNRPVLKDGRCLPTCAKGEFFEKTSGGCRSCDSSCATCSDSGQDACLSCSEGEVLREGKCVKSDGGCDTLQGLGVCLEELVIQPPANPTTGATPPPTPSITGIADPTVVKVQEKNKLQWWQVVLMVLGGFFCLMVVVVLWRRQARKKRAERTKFWAAQRGVLGKGPWWKRIFTRNDQQQRFQGRGGPPEKDELPRYRDDVASQYPPESTVDGFIGAYADEQRASSWERTSMTSRSMFSEMTGERRKAPEPRAPLRELAMSVKSLRTTTIGSDERSTTRSGNGANQKSLLVDVETEAEKYKRSVRERSIAEAETHPGAAPFLATEPFWMQPTATGNSNMSQSRNPFRV